MARRKYETDLSDREWEILQPYIPEPSSGSNREYAMREIVNGIGYLARTGGAWRQMPHDLPHWRSCYGYFRKWEREKIFEKASDRLRQELRKILGKDEEPSMAILDSQSAATTEKGGCEDPMGTRKSKGGSGI